MFGCEVGVYKGERKGKGGTNGKKGLGTEIHVILYSKSLVIKIIEYLTYHLSPASMKLETSPCKYEIVRS